MSIFDRFNRQPTNRQREIFRYWDGTKERGADPLVVLRALVTDSEFDIKTDPELAAQGIADATDRTLKAIRRVLSVRPWETLACGKEVGLTDAETLELLSDFGLYLDGLKKNSSLTPTSQPATGSTDSVSPNPPPDAQPMSESSDSDSTSTDPRRAAASFSSAGSATP
ncbi:MAG TPA: hypothetical protein VGG64_19185 [Pirellulales bacterium]